ncbi:hypothetical protein [Acetobacter sp.]|jgi:hypothetical protein|uniref:hypothetical protein n=1 Tax=Acetobacter sp. TaxID=440 RepID=UPI0025B7FB63|nr:hypothetical protein [Acetobacter sp.]MCH4091560.1 hypothetical protein [Acetobacter sp.]
MQDNVIKIVCESGKELIYKEITPSEMLDIILLCGPDGSKNETYINIVQQWCSIRSINNIPVPFPRNKTMLDVLANDIGMDGIKSIEEHLISMEDNKNNDIDVIKN